MVIPGVLHRQLDSRELTQLSHYENLAAHGNLTFDLQIKRIKLQNLTFKAKRLKITALTVEIDQTWAHKILWVEKVKIDKSNRKWKEWMSKEINHTKQEVKIDSVKGTAPFNFKIVAKPMDNPFKRKRYEVVVPFWNYICAYLNAAGENRNLAEFHEQTLEGVFSNGTVVTLIVDISGVRRISGSEWKITKSNFAKSASADSKEFGSRVK